jgi:hypothetical protein
MTRTQVLLFAALVLAPLFSVLMRAIMRYLEGDRPRDLEPGARNAPVPVRSPPAPAPAPAFHVRDTPRGRVTETASEPGATHGRLGSHGDVRRGLMLMAILGPCRALDPPGASEQF